MAVTTTSSPASGAPPCNTTQYDADVRGPGQMMGIPSSHSSSVILTLVVPTSLGLFRPETRTPAVCPAASLIVTCIESISNTLVAEVSPATL